MKLSTRGRYGVRLMFDLALHYGTGPIYLKDIAERQGVSAKYLWQLINPLKTTGLVNSLRGAHGGYILARPPETISVGEVICAVEGALVPMPCIRDDLCTPCEREGTCAARSVWELVHARLADALDGMSLADLARSQMPEAMHTEITPV